MIKPFPSSFKTDPELGPAVEVAMRIEKFRSSLNKSQAKEFDELIEFILSLNDEDFGLDPFDDGDSEWKDPFDLAEPEFCRVKREERLTVKIQLKNVKPPVWRKLEIPSSMSLSTFSEVINLAMGWSGGHLHGFRIGIDNIDEDSEPDTPVAAFLKKKGDKLTYEYDFGDSWVHGIELVADPVPGNSHRVELKSAKNACPPEDFGGPWYYTDFITAWNNHDVDALKGEFSETVEWLDEDFDPSFVDKEDIQGSLDSYLDF